jgi:cytochrome P450
MADRVLTLADVDLEDNDNFVDAVPHDMFTLLRREAPVHWHPQRHGSGFWAVTKHADVIAVSKDWQTYSSEVGATALEELDAEQIEARKSMLDTDPPAHTHLRKVVNREFTPRAVARYEDLLRRLSREILDRALLRGEFDFLPLVAIALPIQVLCHILGVPDEDHEKLVEWGDQMIANTDPELTAVLLDSPESEKYRMLPFRSPAAPEVFEYGHWLAGLRRKDPRDDLVTKLALAEIDGESLSEREFDTMFLLLVVAGNETTRQAIAHGMQALIEHPDELRRLQHDPALLPTAVDEILRWASPVVHFRRTATRDTELRGVPIREGDKVVVWYVSANRDEDVFEDPFRFDVGRRPNDHVTFGKGGPHFCLGAHLAKLEVRVLFEELLPRIRSAELAGPPVRLRSNFTNGLKRLPVRITPA